MLPRWLAGQLAALAAAAILLAVRPTFARRRLLQAALVAVVAAELVWLQRPVNPPGPEWLFYPATPPIDFLQQRAGDQRMAGIWLVMLPNSAAIFDLDDLRTSSPVKPWLMNRLLAPLVDERRAGIDVVLRLDHPLVDLLGVRWAITPRRHRLRGSWRRAFTSPDGWVWRRPTALPPLFLPQAAEAISNRPFAQLAEHPDFEAVSLVVDGTLDGREHPAAGEAVPALPWRAADPGGSVLAEIATGRERWSARALLTEPRLLATGIYQDGGWRLLAGGVPKPVRWVNGPLVGGWLPAGAHRLDLLYRPPAFLPGLLLAALAIAAAAAWGAAPLRRSEPG
jgi:hypothetical protein